MASVYLYDKCVLVLRRGSSSPILTRVFNAFARFKSLSHFTEKQSAQNVAMGHELVRGVCPKCVISEEFGIPSCCAPGGAWMNMCGDPGDSAFNYTWVEGAQACERTSMVNSIGMWNEHQPCFTRRL